MSDDMLIIIMLVGVLALICFIACANIYATRLNKAVNEMKTPHGIEQIRRKSRLAAFTFLIISVILAYLFV